MKHYIFVALLFLICSYSSAQMKVPKNFYLVEGNRQAGTEDYFTDGQFRLFEDNPFQGDQAFTDEGKMKILTAHYGISFNKLQKNFYYGNGYSDHLFKYVVVLNGFAYILTSKMNNQGFANYSKWLLGQIRFHQSEGDRMYFKQP
jgi:hypothetical protein